MFLHRIVLIVALVLVLATQSAHAFFDPPWITPGAPRAGEVVSVNVSGGICDVFVEWPGYPQITQNGNAIRIVEYGNREGSEDLCNYDFWTFAESIGAFPPGDYTLTVDFAYDNYPLGLTTITLGLIPFTVTAATPAAPVPASTAMGIFVLSTFISGAALRALWMRRRSWC